MFVGIIAVMRQPGRKIRPFLLVVGRSSVTGCDVCVGGAGVILEYCCPQRGAFERPLNNTNTV